ncbi:hypothetical protein Tco_0543593 [Tanacetum coccineum]
METKDTLSSCSNSDEQQMQQIEDKAKKSCMVSFRRLHSHLKLLSNNDLKGTRTECGFKRAFATLFGQDVETFTGTMFLNVDQLEKQLDKEEFQEIGSMAAFKYFLEYTQLEIREFHDTLIQHMESVKKSIDKRALQKREYDSRVNERQMQITEETVDTSKALDASLVETESSGIESGTQDTRSRLGNDADAVNADIKPVYDKEPMAEVQLTAESLKEGQHGQFSKVKSNEAKVKHDIDVPETINIELERKVAKLLKENETLKNHYKDRYDSIKEKGFAIATLKNELRKLKGNNVNTKFVKPSILRKPVLQPHRNQLIVRQPTAFKSERPRILKPRFASQVDVNNDLSKPVTTHYLPKGKESACAKPHHMIAPGSSRYSSNNMVHNHYLEEAKKQTQEIGRSSKTSVMPSAISKSTTDGSKPKPRIDNQKCRNWPASKSSCVSNRTVNIAEQPRNQKPFLKSKDLACPTCKKYIYSANHYECILKYLSKVHFRSFIQKKDAQSHRTKRYMPIEKKCDSKKHDTQIPIGQKFSPNKSSAVYLKTTPLKSGLTWKPTCRIFTQVGLKWIPIRKPVETRYNTNDSASPLEKETHNPKIVICANSSSLSAGHRPGIGGMLAGVQSTPANRQLTWGHNSGSGIVVLDLSAQTYVALQMDSKATQQSFQIDWHLHAQSLIPAVHTIRNNNAGTSLNISIRNAQLQLNLGVPQIQPESTRMNIRPWFSTDFHSTYLQTAEMQITSTPSTTMEGDFNGNVRSRGVTVRNTSTGPVVGYASTIAGNNGEGSSGVHNDSVEMIVIVSGLEPTPMIEVGVLFGLEILALWLARTRFLHGST